MENRKYHIITIGCQMNKSDSERIAAVFEDAGFSETADRKEAGFVVLVTCGVRQAAEDRVYGLVGRIRKENPEAKMIIAGCLSEREDVQARLKAQVDFWMPARKIFDFRFSIFELIKTNANVFENRKSKIENLNYLTIPPKYSSKFSAFVPIGNGCDNFCTYCVVPYARGRETYRSAEEILAEVRGLVGRGYKEITLIAQNVNSYHNLPKVSGPSEGGCFSDLLLAANSIPGDFWIRFATSHPKDMSDELIGAIAACDKVCKHVHLPAQAGDDGILMKMNRKYTCEHYLELVDKIRSQIPNPKSQNPNSVWKPPVSLTTDIIVGFPGETEEQFENTVRLFEAAKFDMAYIAQYSPRPGTAAEKMIDDVPAEEKKRREEKLMQVLRRTALENNQAYIGRTVKVLIEEKNKKGEILGRTGTAKTVKIVGTDESMIGRFVDVRIKAVQDFGMEGEVSIRD